MSDATPEVVWKTHPTLNYQASNDGRVRTLDGRELNLHTVGHGYLAFTITGRAQKAMHRMVCETFHGDPPTPKHEVRHLNGVKTDNRPENLKWGTRSENALDRAGHGHCHETNKTHCPQGHAYTPENTYRRPGAPNKRYCRACYRARSRAKQT